MLLLFCDSVDFTHKMFRNLKGLIQFKFYLCFREKSHLQILWYPLPHLVLRRDGCSHFGHLPLYLLHV